MLKKPSLASFWTRLFNSAWYHLPLDQNGRGELGGINPSESKRFEML